MGDRVTMRTGTIAVGALRSLRCTLMVAIGLARDLLLCNARLKHGDASIAKARASEDPRIEALVEPSLELPTDLRRGSQSARRRREHPPSACVTHALAKVSSSQRT